MIQDVGFCVSNIFFLWKRCIFYMPGFPMETFVKLIFSFLVWKENIQILCCNLLTFARGRLLVCLERIVSSLGKFTEEIGVRYMFDCRVEETGLLGWFFQSVQWLTSEANSYKKACVDQLEKEEIRISKRRRYKFQFYINRLHIWPHVVMFEVIGTDLN